MANKTDWANSKEFRRFAQDWIKRVLPNMKDSAMVLSIAPQGGEADVRMAVEIGFAILLDKPLIVIAPKGRHVAERLIRIADHVITADITTDEGREQIAAAIKAVTNQ